MQWEAVAAIGGLFGLLWAALGFMAWHAPNTLERLGWRLAVALWVGIVLLQAFSSGADYALRAAAEIAPDKAAEIKDLSRRFTTWPVMLGLFGMIFSILAAMFIAPALQKEKNERSR